MAGPGSGKSSLLAAVIMEQARRGGTVLIVESACDLRTVAAVQRAVDHDDARPAQVARLDFEAFFAMSFDRLVRRLAPLCGNDPSQAEEAAQEAFVQAYRRWDQLRDPELAYPWLCRIAIRICQQLWTTRDLRRDLQKRLSAETRTAMERDIAAHMDILTALAELPERQRAVATMALLLEMNAVEIACELGIATGTVRAHLHAARRAIRDRIILTEDREGPTS